MRPNICKRSETNGVGRIYPDKCRDLIFVRIQLEIEITDAYRHPQLYDASRLKT